MPENIVLTSFSGPQSNTVSVRRTSDVDPNRVHYRGSGQHAGLVVNERGDCNELVNDSPAEMQLVFTCVMKDKETQNTHAENRTLRFWFRADKKRPEVPYEFFTQLIDPSSFPRDYVGFVKKVMKQMQLDKYDCLERTDVEFETLSETEQNDYSPMVKEPISEEDIRNTIQQRLDEAFPNCMQMEDLKELLEVDENAIQLQINELVANDVIQIVELEGKLAGGLGFRRNYPTTADEKIHSVEGHNAYSSVAKVETPTIAIITNLLCEKVAVDNVMTDRTTFVMYRTDSESHMYTIGNIGEHRVISVKLPQVKRREDRKISSGSTTTRLLGAFQEVRHVFVVGVAGGVPHVSNYELHSRLGDIVISTAATRNSTNTKDYMYLYCDKVTIPDEDMIDAPLRFDLRFYKSADTTLLDHAQAILDENRDNPDFCPWNKSIQEVLNKLDDDAQTDFSRPPGDTDKLKISRGGGVVFDIKHPDVPVEMAHLYKEGVPSVRLGCIGSGKCITDDDCLRDNFALEHNLLAWDAEYDQVLESVMGNRLSSYIFIHGISDYVDGSKGTQWQPYASLSSAAFMKCIINKIPRDG